MHYPGPGSRGLLKLEGRDRRCFIQVQLAGDVVLCSGAAVFALHHQPPRPYCCPWVPRGVAISTRPYVREHAGTESHAADLAAATSAALDASIDAAAVPRPPAPDLLPPSSAAASPSTNPSSPPRGTCSRRSTPTPPDPSSSTAPARARRSSQSPTPSAACRRPRHPRPTRTPKTHHLICTVTSSSGAYFFSPDTQK